MKVFALLVGIDKYSGKPLNECVKDSKKIKAYLNSIKDRCEEVLIETLYDDQATKTAIVDKIKSHLYKAKDEDVAFFYYSGHGALESTDGLFPEEHDGTLDCLVPFSKTNTTSSDLLANKELRYLFHKMPHNPHLITVIDSCHSGNIVRSYVEASGNDNSAIRRLSGVFTPRPYREFLFAGDKSVEVGNNGNLTLDIPYKNSIHLAACLSSESSWEDSKGGVFTNYLLQLLNATNGNLTYLDIARWSKMTLLKITSKKQTPKVTVQGEGKLSQNSSWLNFNPEGIKLTDGQVSNNKKLGWLYNKGLLLGVKEGAEIIIKIDDEEVVGKVKSVDAEYAILDLPMTAINKMDFNKSYPANTPLSTYDTLQLYINNVDDDQVIADAVAKFLKQHEGVELVAKEEARFYVNCFNNMVYFSMPETEFQPLSKQIDYDSLKLEAELSSQLLSYIKWNHFYSLENPSMDFKVPPIKVEANIGDGGWSDITNGILNISPETREKEETNLFGTFQIRVRNISNEKLFVGVLTLNSDLSITSKPFDGNVIELAPKESKLFYDHKETDPSIAKIYFDNYKEVYNWSEEWFYYKFIINNYEDFSASIQNHSFLQPSLSPPLTITHPLRGAEVNKAKGEGSSEELQEIRIKWGTCITRVELKNPTFNVITAGLKTYLDEYLESEELAPFIKELYFEDFWNGKEFEVRLKQNKFQSAEKATDSWVVKQLNKIYNTIRRRRFRRQRKNGGPIVVAEGDSWFLYPRPGVKDTLDYIMNEYAVFSLADAGDDVADYIKNNELINKVGEIKPDFVLISGGGNDVLGSEIRSMLRKNVGNVQSVKDYINEDILDAKMNFLDESYRMFFSKIKLLVPNVKIFIHGYDYIPGDRDKKIIEKGWANKYMIEAGINNPKDRDHVIHFLVDRFNTILKGYEDEFNFVGYVNNRKTVAYHEWMDEIHPNNIGYGKVAGNFLKKMKEFSSIN